MISSPGQVFSKVENEDIREAGVHLDPPDGTGLLKRRPLRIAAKMAIGKEGELRDDLAGEVAGIKAGLEIQTFEKRLSSIPTSLKRCHCRSWQPEQALRLTISVNMRPALRASDGTAKKVVRALQDRDEPCRRG